MVSDDNNMNLTLIPSEQTANNCPLLLASSNIRGAGQQS